MTYTVIAFYKFVHLNNIEEMRNPLRLFCLQNNIRGTILLGKEGINSTIAGTKEACEAVLSYLRSDPRLADLEHKESYALKMPFHHMKVKLKREIVTMGVDTVDPNACVGEYVEPKAWNELISDPDVLVVDTRNDYEFNVGHFKRAIDPKTKSFTQFPDYVKEHLKGCEHKKIAMYCTGGIRCEKATSYMLEQGYEHIYHLKGGILKYLEEVSLEESLWQGECFVFDQRVSVKQGLELGSYTLCYGCQNPVSYEDRQSTLYEKGVCCPQCHEQLSQEKRQRLKQRQHQVELCASRGERHIGY